MLPQAVAAHPLVTLSSRPGMGRVLFAATSITAGQVVIDEAPVLVAEREECLVDSLSRAVATKASSRREADLLANVTRAWIAAPSKILDELHLDTTSKAWKRCVEVAEAVSLVFATVDANKLARALRAVQLNGFASGSKVVVFGVASLLSHACRANVEFDDGRFAALEDIKPGTLLTVNYLSPPVSRMPTVARRQFLSQTKGFWCECARCLGDDLCRRLPCPGCDGFIAHSLARQRADSARGWKCDTCDRTFPFGASVERATKLLETERRYLAASQSLPRELLDVAARDIGRQHYTYRMLLEKY